MPKKLLDSISQLVNSRNLGETGGYIIIDGNNEFEYVQYCLEADGLLYNWPTLQEGGEELLPVVIEALQAIGFSQFPLDNNSDIGDQISDLGINEFLVCDDGLYGQSGRDVNRLTEVSSYLLKNVFKISDLESVNITLELYE